MRHSIYRPDERPEVEVLVAGAWLVQPLPRPMRRHTGPLLKAAQQLFQDRTRHHDVKRDVKQLALIHAQSRLDSPSASPAPAVPVSARLEPPAAATWPGVEPARR